MPDFVQVNIMKSDDAIFGDGERDMKIVAWNVEKLRHKKDSVYL